MQSTEAESPCTSRVFRILSASCTAREVIFSRGATNGCMPPLTASLGCCRLAWNEICGEIVKELHCTSLAATLGF